MENWASPLLARLQPGERRTLARKIGTELRRSQSQRIGKQQAVRWFTLRAAQAAAAAAEVRAGQTREDVCQAAASQVSSRSAPVPTLLA